jgi:long-chain acyl-CoA synthetase
VALAFWNLDHPAAATAVVLQNGQTFSYGELASRSDALANTLQSHKKRTFGFLLCRNGVDCLAAYLGALRHSHVVCLLDAEMPSQLLHSLLETYEPDFVFSPDAGAFAGYALAPCPFGFLYRRDAGFCGIPLASELALLLATSGSTGSPKLVRLSLENLNANASSIVSYLQLTAQDRGLASLPMSYSYGLSVINSHLLTGASLLIPGGSFLQRAFWDFVDAQCPTSLAGVPYHYEVMLKMRILERELSRLRLLTQAGGRLSPDRVSQIAELSFRRGWQFFVMYGQTEATARIAYLPPERVRDKPDSIGIAIPQGQLSLDEVTGELLYSGPNVMLGYAENRADLAKGDELRGRLRTGDLARCDDEGFHYIVGRLKRFLKIYGKRFNLDQLEDSLGRQGCGPVACFGSDDHLVIAVEQPDAASRLPGLLQQLFHIHANAFRIIQVGAFPRFPNRKIDYQSLSRQEALG